MDARVDAVEAYLIEHRTNVASWHATLNNHASTRPKRNGGKLVHAVSDCKTYRPPSSASALWRCSLDLPASFAPADGRRLQTEGYGITQCLVNAIAIEWAHAVINVN